MKIDSIVDLLSSVFPVFKKWSLILKKQNFAQAKIKCRPYVGPDGG
jgi:hypothetical protein